MLLVVIGSLSLSSCLHSASGLFLFQLLVEFSSVSIPPPSGAAEWLTARRCRILCAHAYWMKMRPLLQCLLGREGFLLPWGLKKFAQFEENALSDPHNYFPTKTREPCSSDAFNRCSEINLLNVSASLRPTK